MTASTPMLDTIRTSADRRRLEPKYIRRVAAELRAETISAVAVTGGHLGAGLGVVELTVADARFAKPLDVDLVRRLAREHEVLVTIEEGAVGGFGARVLQMLSDHGLLDRGL